MKSEIALVKNTDFEKLLCKIKEEREVTLASELNQRRLRDIIKEIASVYFFLRTHAEMPKRELTLEEFETTRVYLHQNAEKEIRNKWRHRAARALGFKTAWQYYFENGFFKCRTSPYDHTSGEWDRSHTWHPDSYSTGYSTFDPETVANNSCPAIPPNLKELTKAVFEKRHQQKQIKEK